MSLSSRRPVRLKHRKTLKRSVDAWMENLEQRIQLTGDFLVTTLHDVNGNGVKDLDEPALVGWTVFVDYNRDGVVTAGEPSGVTNIDGEAFLLNVPKGTYDVREIPAVGWGPSAGFDVFDRVVLKDGDTLDVLFLNIPVTNGGIRGTVWNDRNGNGTRQTTDPGLAGWTVFLDTNDDRVLQAAEMRTTTSATGAYAFNNLPAGDYNVAEVLPFGWDTTLGFDQSKRVSVSPSAVTTNDFGNVNVGAIGAIAGSVWNDVNADGVRAVGDAGLSGWSVFIDTNANSLKDVGETAVLTDGLGNFSIPSLPAGTYRLVEVLQTGWKVSVGYPTVRTVSVVGENTTNVQFAVNTPTPGSISGKVWNDVNGDGAIGLEAGLAGWKVFIDVDNDGVLDLTEKSATTSATGTYTLSGVTVGANTLRVVTQTGWQPTAPGTGVQLVTVPNGTTVPNVNFGLKQRTDATISGVAYVDANTNHLREAGEKLLSGIKVYLDTNNNGLLDTGEPNTLTSTDLFYTPSVDETGRYSFDHLPAGAFVVREILPPELSATLVADRKLSINLLTGEQRTNADFANRYRSIEIRGVKYEDVNGNHVRDAAEPGVPGVTIYLDLNRNNILDVGEPTTVTAADGSYGFANKLVKGSYVVREIVPAGWTQKYPQTLGGTLWPTGTSHAAVGNVTPTLIQQSLSIAQQVTKSVSLTLPSAGSLTNMVDVFLLFDDTGSFTSNSPIVRAAFPQIIASLQLALPGVNFAFGVGRFEEYANFASESPTGRPFILNQPVIASSTPGFSTAIQAALDRTAPGYGGDGPETDIEALYQVVTGRGFDGNNNGTTTESGPAGSIAAQLTPGASGDVPAYGSFSPGTGVLPATGTVGGAGFRAGALPIILTATDIGFAFQPKGETSITGVGGVSLPVSALTGTSRPSSPFNSGAGIQETISGLNALGALVIGLGTNGDAVTAPRSSLEALAKLTGAVNRSLTTIPNGTLDPIAPGDPLYFQIASGFGTSVADGIVTAIKNAVANVSVNIALKSSDPTVKITGTPTVVNGVKSGGTAAFSVTFTGDGKPHRFDLQFVRQGTDVVLGSIPVVLGTPIIGNGYQYDEVEDGEIDNTVDFGNQRVITTLQAESATLAGGTIVSAVNAGFTGTGYADFAGNASSAQWSITRTSSGKSILDFVYANGSTVAQPLSVLVNGVKVGTIQNAPTGAWTTWKSEAITTTLPAGVVTIKLLAGTAGGANVDALKISAVVPATLQAERATLSVGTVKSTTNAGYTGTGYADFGTTGSTATFTIARTTASPVLLSFRYANGLTTTAPVNVLVNGKVVGSLSFGPTGAWTTWATATLNTSLLAGNNTIQLATTSTNGANLDWISVG